jgi:hypothetical protein
MRAAERRVGERRRVRLSLLFCRLLSAWRCIPFYRSFQCCLWARALSRPSQCLQISWALSCTRYSGCKNLLTSLPLAGGSGPSSVAWLFEHWKMFNALQLFTHNTTSVFVSRRARSLSTSSFSAWSRLFCDGKASRAKVRAAQSRLKSLWVWRAFSLWVRRLQGFRGPVSRDRRRWLANHS